MMIKIFTLCLFINSLLKKFILKKSSFFVVVTSFILHHETQNTQRLSIYSYSYS